MTLDKLPKIMYIYSAIKRVPLHPRYTRSFDIKSKIIDFTYLEI